MMSITVTFALFVTLFGFIGALRGWAKELLVIFSIILALFMVYVLEEFIDFVKPFSDIVNPLTADVVNNTVVEEGQTIFSSLSIENQEELRTQFWVRAILVTVLTFFGYQTPKFASFLNRKSRPDQVQDLLFGAVLGSFNGFMIMGTLWSYMHSAYYLFEEISAPVVEDFAWEIISYLPPNMIGNEVGLLIAVAVSFLFVLIVFV